MRWAGYVARIGREEEHTVFWWGNLRERDDLEDPGVNGRIILMWIFRELNGKGMDGLIWLRIRIGGGLF
jgi:hypothetical protein